MYRCILINAPKIFQAAWKVISKFIDPVSKQKIKVLGKNYLDEMSKIIPLDQIPQKFGGTATNPIKLGYSADLPHDRYPLDYYELKEAAASNPVSDIDVKESSEYEVKEQ